MDRIRVSIVIALLTVLVSTSAAQQAATPTQKSGAGIDTVINCVGAQNGRIPVFTASAPPNIQICNSGIYEAAPYGSGAIGILNPNPIAALDVRGDINTSLYYQIGGSTVLSIGSPADGNVFLGVGAGSSDVAGQGLLNTFSGYQAGHNTTTGRVNTFIGAEAGYANTTGYDNTFSGYQAGFSNTTGGANTFNGSLAGGRNTTGSSNTFSGWGAGESNTTGSGNTFSGWGAGPSNTAGNDNTFTGFAAGNTNSGSGNTFLGFTAGTNETTGSNNIIIGNPGCAFPCAESNTIRIGGDTGLGQQTAAYIAGIFSATSFGGIQVFVNSDGQLGTQTSARRFKEQIHDMGDRTDALMKLRPVTFFYKPEYEQGERTLQYGLVAEEVAEVYPELVAYDTDGQPYTVRYQYLASMLLNEVQKQYRRALNEAEVIKAQQQEIDNLKQQLQIQNASLQQRLSRLEDLVRAQVQTIAQERK